MKIWEKEAIDWLEKSIKPFPQELNEIDWKLDLSPNTDRLAQHLSAFSNYDGGGFLVFGVGGGKIMGVDNDQCTKIITVLGNIARQNLVPPIVLDHAVTPFQDKNLLFIKIGEAQDRPIHLRSGPVYDSYIRSAGQTRKMDKIEVANLISKSQGLRFEDGISETGLSAEAALKKIDFTSYFDMIERPLPSGNEAILDVLCADKFARKNGALFDITNLGAILFAHKPLSKMNKDDKVRACYLHCCLKYVAGKEKMNNTTLRERFQIKEKNYPIASGIISDTIEAGLIKPSDPNNKSKRYMSYIPFWA